MSDTEFEHRFCGEQSDEWDQLHKLTAELHKAIKQYGPLQILMHLQEQDALILYKVLDDYYNV